MFIRKILLCFLLLTLLCGQAKFVPFMVSSGSPLAIVGTNMGQQPFDYSPEVPFLNILKEAQFFTYTNAGAATGEETLLYTSFLDSNGYPTTLTGGPAHNFQQLHFQVLDALASTVGSPVYYYNAGDYLLQWTGSGGFKVGSDAVVDCTVGGTTFASPCKITVNSPGNGGLTFQQTCTTAKECTGAGSTVDYAHNFSLIYCGTYTSGNPVGQKCSATNAGGTHVDALETQCEAGTYASCFNPDLLARLKGAKLLRFMQWNVGTPNTIISAWANRRVPTWYSFADGPSNLSVNGMYPQSGGGAGFYDGVPYEYQIALCNVIGADCYFVAPALADDNYVTQLGTLTHNTLNAPLKAYVELGNEIWNNVQATEDGVGTITGFVDDGSTSPTPSGVPGKILTVTAIATTATGTPKLNGTPYQLSGTGLAGKTSAQGYPTQIGSQITGSAGSTGTYNTTGDSAGGNQVTGSETITLNINVSQNLAWLGAQNYSSYAASANLGATETYGEYLRAVQIGHLFQAAWGADSARVVRVAGAFPFTDSGSTISVRCILQALPTDSTCANQGGPAHWYGSQGGTLASNMDAVAIHGYYAYGFPAAWSADADGGLTKFFNEMITGGVEPTANVTGNCGNGAGKTCTPSDTAHYTLTSGQSLSSDPPNGTMLMAMTNAGSTQSSGHTYLTVDTMSQYPILWDDSSFDNNTDCPGNDIGGGPFGSQLAINTQYVFTFTTAFSGCTGGSITKGWRALGKQWSNASGMINDIIAGDATVACPQTLAQGGSSFPLISYEGGQTFTAGFTGHPSATWYKNFLGTAMRDARMGTAYDYLFQQWAAMGGGCKKGVFTQFQDIFLFNGQFWGLLENVIQTSSPRYDVVHHTYWQQPYLLHRDLDPASNDNSPVGLNKVA